MGIMYQMRPEWAARPSLSSKSQCEKLNPAPIDEPLG